MQIGAFILSVGINALV